MEQIKLKNVTIQYENSPVIDNLSLTISKGDYICVLGDNGAGKTTLTKGILGLEKLKKGEIEYLIKKDMIGYLPQKKIIQKDFPSCVYEVVMSGLITKKGLRPFFNKEEKNIAKKNMERLGIWDIRKKPFCELSGGQQQRALLARALCAGSEILFLDEPVTGLDNESTHVFYETVSELNKEGISIFMVSHDISLAIKNAKHILYLGKENFFGTVSEFKNTDIFYKI